MKSKSIFLTFILLPFFAPAHEVTIRDKSSLQPLENVVISSELSGMSQARFTNHAGRVDTPARSDADLLTFRRIGYQTAYFTLAQLRVMILRFFWSRNR